MKLIAPLTATCLAVIFSGQAAAQLSGSVVAGYDSNPLKLSDTINSSDAAFSAINVRWEHEIGGGFGFDVRGDRTFFADTQVQDPDQSNISAALNYENKGSLINRSVKYHGRIRISENDKTFISRNTGLVGVASGVEIPDRFDAQTLDARVRADIDISDVTRLRIELRGRDKSYTDYSSLGLSNLDYDQYSIVSALRIRPNKTHDIRLQAQYHEREHDNRPGRDLLGATIPGSNLEFSFVDFGVSWKFDVAKRQDVRIGVDFGMRTDDLSGFYDTTTEKASIRYRNRTSPVQRWSARVSYTDFEYDNLADVSVIDDELNVGPKNGPELEFTYDRKLLRTDDAEIWLASEIKFEDFDSPNATYAYDRSLVWLGLEAEF